ncbi:hypothetical protein GN956_G17132 [Arapaima gigas]
MEINGALRWRIGCPPAMEMMGWTVQFSPPHSSLSSDRPGPVIHKETPTEDRLFPPCVGSPLEDGQVLPGKTTVEHFSDFEPQKCKS